MRRQVAFSADPKCYEEFKGISALAGFYPTLLCGVEVDLLLDAAPVSDDCADQEEPAWHLALCCSPMSNFWISLCAGVQGRAFEGWAEGPLDFAPTYKFRRGTSVYVGAPFMPSTRQSLLKCQFMVRVDLFDEEAHFQFTTALASWALCDLQSSKPPLCCH